MADFVSIANLAASGIGEDDQLRSPDDDTHLSRSVKAVWDIERRAVIRAHTWNFAMRRQQLAALAGEAPFPWAASFKMPADSVRLVEVLGRAVGPYRRDYQLEGNCILTNSTGPVPIRYLADVVEPALWDDLFVVVFARRLGWAIADRITGDRGRKDDAFRVYRDALSDARRVDARENPQIVWEPTDWELARARGGSFGVPYGNSSEGWWV